MKPTTFILEVGGTSKHITSKNSKEEFASFSTALDRFYEKVEALNIPDHDIEVDIEAETADTQMIGHDYVVTIYKS